MKIPYLNAVKLAEGNVCKECYQNVQEICLQTKEVTINNIAAETSCEKISFIKATDNQYEDIPYGTIK